jgi:hypothetical protein
MPERELTRDERAAIRKLVVQMCANYDYKFGCLPLDYGRCYMLDKYWTGSYCKYFVGAVLPLDPELETALMGKKRPPPPAAETKPCETCGKRFIGDGRHKYCSKKCADKALKKSWANSSRKYRRK